MRTFLAAPETENLLALRRTLWQLLGVGIAAAIVLTSKAPAAGSAALWCVVLPASALLVHFRRELLARMRMRVAANVHSHPSRRSW
ncbi:MAG: hypothetical protein JSS44_09910 [Proteobacteria bacterium]|nr:hypothetical protein [Pseudomonadota bacterium]MBS0464154.1 hypothetical protein [Pseudomonadota bacterium]